MSRFKTFDSTGLATAGRIYAGDLNAIQDQMADLVNLVQALSVASVAVGEAGLQITRFGPGEARISGALRTDNKIRAGGGLDIGITTTQRDALPAGSRPPGMLIFNTTTGRPEANIGTDAVPNWQGQYVEFPIGAVVDWPWASGNIPSWALLCYGQPVNRTTYSALNALASAAGYAVYGAGDGSTTFNLPDMRGRVTAGKDDMGGTVSAPARITAAVSGINGLTLGAVGGAEGITLVTGQLPNHNHGPISTDAQGAHTPAGTLDAQGSHSHGGGTQGRNTGHTHTSDIRQAGGTWGLTSSGGGFQGNVLLRPGTVGGTAFGYITDGESVDHSHVITTDGSHGHNFFGTPVGNHSHSVTPNTVGSDQAHRNMQPTIIVNKMIRAL